MSYDAIGRRYARAIFELAKEEGQATAVADQIGDFAATYESSRELETVLDDPLIADEQRNAIVKEIAERTGAGPTAQRAVRLIARQRRLRAIPDIARHLRRLVDEDAKVVRAHATTATQVSSSFLDKLKGEIERATGNKVVLTHTVDPTLIGGVVTRIGDRIVDGSIRSRLRAFRDATRPTT